MIQTVTIQGFIDQIYKFVEVYLIYFCPSFIVGVIIFLILNILFLLCSQGVLEL